MSYDPTRAALGALQRPRRFQAQPQAAQRRTAEGAALQGGFQKPPDFGEINRWKHSPEQAAYATNRRRMWDETSPYSQSLHRTSGQGTQSTRANYGGASSGTGGERMDPNPGGGPAWLSPVEQPDLSTALDREGEDGTDPSWWWARG